MYTPKLIDGNIVQKSQIVNDNFRDIRRDLIDLYGRYYQFQKEINSVNAFGRQLVSDMYNISSTINNYSSMLDNVAYTDERSIVTMYEGSKIYTHDLISEEEETETSSGITAIHDPLTSTLGFPYINITSLYSTVVKQQDAITFVPTANIGQYIDIIVRDEYKFTMTTNGEDALFDNSQVFILRLNTSDVTTTSAEVTIRMYMVESSPEFNEIRMILYPEASAEIYDGATRTTLSNGINAVNLSPSYYLDLTLTSSSYSIEGDGSRTFLFTIPVFQVSNVQQNNYGMVGLYVPKKKAKYLIEDFSIDSNIDVTYSFKVFSNLDDMKADINELATSELMPIDLLSNRYQVNVLDYDHLYFLINLYKENLTDVSYINSFSVVWG